MTETQKQHLNRILDQTHMLLVDKYVKGAKEHNSDLSQDYTVEQIIDMWLEEAVDSMTYGLTLREIYTKENGGLCDDCKKKR